MTGPEGDHGPLNLVAADLFFGLGAVILVAVAALSLNVRNMLSEVMGSQGAGSQDTLQAAAALSATTGPILLADAAGLHRLADGAGSLIALDDLWAAPDLPAWLAETPLLVVAPQGQDAAFLTFSRAAGAGTPPLATLRLTQDCRALRLAAQGIQCEP
jgi:hypothetical protein